MSKPNNHDQINIGSLIPIKGHSERVPGKNFLLLGSQPLYLYILKTLFNIKFISHIYIDTDVPEKIIIPNEMKKKIRIIERPVYLQGDDISVNSLIEYDLQFIDEPIILQTHTTNPFLSKSTIESCVNEFINGNHKSLFTVTIQQNRFWYKGKPINHDVNFLLRTQDIEPVYEENSLIYLFSKLFFSENKKRINLDSNQFLMSKSKETVDIDTLYDWGLAELLYESER